MKINQKYLMIVSEALIPVLGFFLWNWNLYFILLFYFLDLIANELMMHYKASAVVKAQGPAQKSTWVKRSLVSAALLLTVIVLVHFALYFIHPDINFFSEMKLFWEYKELGIPQGYLLVPFVLLASLQQVRLLFLMRGQDRVVKMDTMWKKHMAALLVCIAGAGLGVGISQFFVFPEVVYVVAIVAIAAGYGIRFKN